MPQLAAPTIVLGDIRIDVTRKRIRHLHLRVHLTTGSVRISAPMRMSNRIIHEFAEAKVDWIRRQQEKARGFTSTPASRFTPGEQHPLWGTSYPLCIAETAGRPSIALVNDAIHFHVRAGTSPDEKAALFHAWYRREVQRAAPPLIARWEQAMNVRASRMFVRRMRSKWGSCNTRTRSIRLNSELAKRAPHFLEYIVVHELVHLLEPSHNARFKALMDRYLPGWRDSRRELNGS